MKRIAIPVIAALLLSGCGYAEETYNPAYESGVSEEQSSDKTKSDISIELNKPESGGDVQSLSSAPAQPAEKEEPDFLLRNVWYEGNSYRLGISGTSDENGVYHSLTLDLYSGSVKIDTLEITVPEGDRVLIMESVAEGRTYGCEIISNKQEFGAEEYPDIAALDFYRESDIEIPQYERFFAIFDGKITELDIYENGKPAKPVGTHLDMKSAGIMTQKLCVSGASEYMVLHYRYRFDVENRRLIRTEY